MTAAAARRFVGFALLAAGVFAVFAVLLLGGVPPWGRSLVSSLGLLICGTLTIFSALHRGRHGQGRRRRSWLVIAVGALVAVIANLGALLVGAGVAPASAGGATESLLAAAYLLSVVGMLLFPSFRRRRTDLGRMALDGVVIGGSVLFVVSVLVFPQLLAAPEVGYRLSQLAFPVSDVLVATVAALLISRSGRDERVPLVLLASGFLLYTVSDLAYAVLNVHGDYTLGSPFDLGWIAAYLLIALAARHPQSGILPAHSPRAADGRYSDVSTVPGTVVLFVLFVGASLVSVIGLQRDAFNAPLIALWLVIVLGVIGRQILLVLDNDRLRRGLESRVQHRTRELAQITRQQEMLLASVADGIYGVDTAGLITFVNPAAVGLLQRSEAALIGRNAHDLFHAPRADGQPYPADRCYIGEAITQGKTASLEEDSYLTGSGQVINVDVTASPLGDESAVLGAVVVFRDVTARREVDRMKSEFVSIVSHELRTPLTSIRGSLGLVVGGAFGALPDAANRMLDIALQSSDRLTRLINDILDIERIGSTALPMTVVACRARDLVDDAVRQAAVAGTGEQPRIESSAVSGTVRGDADRIVQTLINLLGNAVKFSAAGSTITVTATPHDRQVEFAVIDRGRGIPSDRLDSVFERFVQIDSSDAREKGGTGLGLAISRSIVERLGGRIWAEHTEGGGATFRFTLPRADSPLPSPSATVGPTVVVCDDDPQIVDVLSATLRERGYRTIGVTSGQEAIAVTRTQHPAALVLDLRMPETSGADVVGALRADEATASVPIVVVSGLRPSRDPQLAAVTDGWVVKPAGDGALAQAVSLAIERHTSHGDVLIVEDDNQLARVMQTLLERRGLTVRHARTRLAAGDEIAAHRPHVLILDLFLPDGSGFDLVADLRASGRLTDLPLVVYSATDLDPAERDRLSLGTTMFLTKGRVTPQDLERQVVQLMDQLATQDTANELVLDRSTADKIVSA